MKIITKINIAAACTLLESPVHAFSFQAQIACSSTSCRPRIRRSVFSTQSDDDRQSKLRTYMQSNSFPSQNNLSASDTDNNDEIDSIQNPQSMMELIVNNDDEKSIYDSKKISNNKRKVAAAAVGLFVACTALVSFSGNGAWRYYLSGGICAAISHAVTTPVDVIKTRKQVDESLKDLSVIQSGIKIAKDDGGFNALLAGLGPTIVGYLFEGAVKFGVYEVAKPIVRSILLWCATLCSMPWMNSKLLGFLISAGIAGTAASIMLCPMEALRIRLVAEPKFAANGWVDCGLNMVNNEGVRGLWKSFPAMLSKQVPYTITKNVSFDFITTIAYSTVAAWGLTICGKTKIVIPLLSAMFASVLSCISSQPGDMLLTVVNAHEGKGRTIDFAHSIMKENGLRGFFIGLKERFLHVSLIVTMQLSIYDFVKRLVGIAATGL